MSVMLKAKGLHTYANDLDAVPKGALQKAENTIIDRDGVIESRRGFKQYADIHADQTDRAKQLLEYKDRMIVHYANKLAYDNGSGVLTDFAGSYNELQSGLRIKGLEANGNFYFTTSDGIKKISATSSSQFTTAAGYIRDAGGIEALDITAKVNYSTPGFLYPESKVAYRVVWAYKDSNDNLILGAPSPLTVVTNASENEKDSAVVDLTFPIPNEIGPNDTQFYYQVYRTAVKLADGQPLDNISPGDEMYLVLEDYPTTTELTTTRVISLQDITPEDFRASGTLLYTNPNSGEGILQANTPPPIAKDITMYQESVFYANTQTKQYLDLSFLSVSQLVSGVSTFTITTGDITNTYTFVGTPEISEISFDSVSNTNDGGYFLISSAGNNREYFVWADKTGNTTVPDDVDTEGRIGLRVDLTYSPNTDIPVVGSVSPGGTFNINNIELGEGAQPQSTEITFDTFANTTDGSYFLINSNNNDSLFFVWLDKTGSTPQPTAPDTIGRTAIHVDISSAVTDEDVATAVANELSSIGVFVTSVVGGVMTVDTNITFNEVAGRVGDVLTLSGDFSVVRVDNVLTITTSDNGYTNLTVDGDTSWGGALFNINNISSGTGEDIANKQILLSNAPTPAQAIDNTARSLIRVINQTPTESVYAFYLSDETSLPGVFYLQSRDVANPQFFVFVNDSNTSSQFNPPLPIQLSGTTNTGNPTVTITSIAHGLTNGQSIVIFNATTNPIINGTYVISNVTTDTFDIQAIVNVSGSVSFGITNDVFSTNEIKPNRLYYSKYQQPEAVPIVNYLDIGPKDKAILRILALRDSLFIFKEEAIYRLTGTSAPDWTVTLFDSSGILLAPDSAVVLNNQIYCLTTQGVARITDTGFGVISRPIEDKIQKIIYQNPSFKTASFGVSYETDRAYLLWIPLNKNDTESTYCLRFNTFTESWTEWNKANVSGRVMSYNDKMYLGATSNIIEEERKTLERTDYADYEYLKIMGPNAINGNEVTLNSNLGMNVGDIVVQTQYVTIATFNRLLNRLDNDILVSDNDYFASLKMNPGDDLTNSMTNLVVKLNNDPSTQLTYTFSGTTNFEQIQAEYNVIIDTLNNDPGVYLSDYRHSNGTYLAEMRVDGVINNTNRIITNQVPPLLVGEMTHYVAITTDIIYTPQDFDDPSQYKQISEATFIFEDSVFTSAKAGYNSDLSPSFEYIPFTADGDGDWGNFSWGEQTWGGEGDQVPLRTYVPREKQRCRFLRPRFIHNNAWEHYAIFGITFNPRTYSTRSYR